MSGVAEPTVVRIPREDVSRVIDTLTQAFRDYPVMRYVLGDCGEEYDVRLRTLVGFFVMARALRDEPLFGIPENDQLCAAAIVSYPERAESPEELGVLREQVWAEVGHDARVRYDRCGQIWRPLGIETPHIHLNMIGVLPSHQGRGLARRLLDHVHGLSRSTPGSEGVTLTTEDPGNVAIYRRVGYEVVGHARVAPELETWAMFRRN
jgi:ribosomal protein S18 acetylase RimI-like enzyme